MILEPSGISYERARIPLNRNISLSAVFHALGVRDELPGTNYGNFTPPDYLYDSKD